MTYRELQSALKQLRNEGKIPANFKLNQKKVVLQAIWDEMNAESYIDDSTGKFHSWDHFAAWKLSGAYSNMEFANEYLKASNENRIAMINAVQLKYSLVAGVANRIK